jgi:hypothetical protein
MNRVGTSLGDTSRRGMSQLVGLADDEIFEGKALVESSEVRLVLANFDRYRRLRQSGRVSATIF